MKFTLSWLKEFLDTDASAKAIGEALTSLGLEVESIEHPGRALAPFIVAEIQEAVPHPNADKLRVCQVNDGKGIRTVVCGAPNARAGIKVVLADIGVTIPNGDFVIKRSAIRGVESAGMLCSAAELNLGGDSAGIIELPADAPVGQSIVPVLGLDEVVIDLSVTANRADALGVYGLARDLAAKGIGTLKKLPPAVEPNGEPCPVSVTIEDKDGCAHFMGAVIRGVKNGESPSWLKQRLEAVGLRPISALVDITNYFTLAFARPLHVYDLAKLQGGIVVRQAREGETLAALNNKDYMLKPGMTVIADSARALGLAGIIGGIESGVTEATTDVFLEAAWFAPLPIARTGRALGVHSDARFRFERGVDPGFTREGHLRAIGMITELCGGTPSALVEAGAAPVESKRISFSPEFINGMGGTNFSAEAQRKALEALGFVIDSDQALVPSYRADIGGQADLAEEVLRVLGYEHIPSTPLPRMNEVAVPMLSALQTRVREAKRLLAARGLMECVSWSFLPESWAQAFGGGAAELKLANPISADLSDMRPSLLPYLLKAAADNARRGMQDVNLFEVGLTWQNATPTGQANVAATLRSGEASAKGVHQSARAVDAFDAKADAFALIAQAGLPTANLTIEQGKAPAWYHPGRSASLLLGKKVVAHFGEIHPSTRAMFELDEVAVACEVFLEAMPYPKYKGAQKGALVTSDFQANRRDFAFVMDADKPVGDLLLALRKAEKQLLQSADVFDVYQGKGVPEGKKSVAVSVVLQAADRTLTDAEITGISDALTKAAASLGAELR